MDKYLCSLMPPMCTWKHIQPCLPQVPQQVPVQHLTDNTPGSAAPSSLIYFPALVWIGGGSLSETPPFQLKDLH